MRPIGFHYLFSVLFLLIPSAYVRAGEVTTDQEVIQALKEQGDPAVAVWLESSGGRFLGLYTADTTGPVKGGVMLVHDVAAHPDWPGVVHTLRSRLPEFGWRTLAMEAPRPMDSNSDLLVTGALEEGMERIGAGLGHFKNRNILNIVLLGYGWGAVAAARYLADIPDSEITALILISPSVPGGGAVPLASWMQKTPVPVLDVFGGRDPLQARKDAAKRLAAGRGGDGVSYRQIMIDGADHAYSGLEDVLIKRVRGWLKKVAGAEVINE